MAKVGIQPITTASLALPKISAPGIVKPAKPAKRDPKSLQALFGQKRMKPTVQSVPTKVASF